MAEYFPGFIPESSAEDDDDDSKDSAEKKTSKKAEKVASKEQHTEDKSEKQERERDVPLERLADDEASVIAAELARLRAEAARQELTDAEDGSPEQTVAIPVVEFDEALQRNLEEGQPFDEALENAEASAVELLGEDVPIETEEPGPEDATPELEADFDADGQEDDDAASSTQNSSAASHVPPVTGGTSGTSPPLGPVNGAPGGGGTVPPAAGGNGAGGVPPNMPPGPQHNQPTPPGGPGFNANQAPTVVVNTETIHTVERRSMAPYLLVGGLMGYLVGRRRGRIKTERKLLPVQKKLEEQVVKLEDQIAYKEQKIRDLTRKQAERQPTLQAAMVERKLAQRAAQKETHMATEAQQSKRAATERLGKLAFAKETTIAKVVERDTKSVDRMTTQEVLVIAKAIKIEQGDVKRLYETGRLDDKGLRRVIKAYLSGEAYERVLRDQLRPTEVEGIEADPTNISDQPGLSGVTSTVSSHGNQTISDLPPVQDISSRPTNMQQTTPTYNYHSPLDMQFPQKKSDNKRTAIITSIVAIAVVIVLLLLF